MPSYANGQLNSIVTLTVADPDHFDTDPDPAFHFESDPSFQFDMDPDPTA
jgi:hypothetical protein